MIHTVTQTAKFKLFNRKLRALIPNSPISIETIAVGILERLWHLTVIDAYHGDIGKLSDDMIAEMIGWEGDSTLLINALVECKWVDRHPIHRLVTHDWHMHCPKFVKGNVTQSGVPFASEGSPPEDTRNTAPVTAPVNGPRNTTPVPNLTKPNLTKPNQNIFADPPKAADAPGAVSEPDEKPKPAAKAKAKQQRPPNLLFDALAEVTASDPEVSGSYVGKVVSSLNKAGPPYTPDDVREFGRRFYEFCPWGANPPRAPTLSEVEKNIGKLRAKSPPPTGGKKSHREAEEDFTAQMFADAYGD